MSEPTEREWLEGLRLEDEMEFYLSSDFPTDEDVEAGVRGVEAIWGAEQVIRTRAYGWVRAALQAVADARRTEEEG